MSKYGIIFIVLFCRLERAPTFLVHIINPPFAETAGILCAKKLCSQPEL
jgi:hypothetical protein